MWRGRIAMSKARVGGCKARADLTIPKSWLATAAKLRRSTLRRRSLRRQRDDTLGAQRRCVVTIRGLVIPFLAAAVMIAHPAAAQWPQQWPRERTEPRYE